MTIDELLSAFAHDSQMQINVMTDEGTLVYVPDLSNYRDHRQWESMRRIGNLSVRSVRIEMVQTEDAPALLLVLNELEEETYEQNL